MVYLLFPATTRSLGEQPERKRKGRGRNKRTVVAYGYLVNWTGLPVHKIVLSDNCGLSTAAVERDGGQWMRDTHLDSCETDLDVKQLDDNSVQGDKDGTTNTVGKRESGEVGSDGNATLLEEDGEEDEELERLDDGVAVASYKSSDALCTHFE